MNITIDYTLGAEHIGGMGKFVKNIAEHLIKEDKNNKYLLIKNPIDFDNRSIAKKIVSVLHQHVWYQTGVVNQLSKSKADIFFSPNPPVPLFSNRPLFLTIADLSFYYDDKLPLLVKIYLFCIYFLAAKKAKIITTFSEYSKKDIQKILKVNPAKIKVTPLAADDIYNRRKSNKSKAVLTKFKITKDYILCTPGTFLPRKNISDLMIAFSNLPEPLRNKLQLVLVGKNYGRFYGELKTKAEALKIAREVIFTDYISETDKLNLYLSAKLFVYPSLYEGFGLPPLEAMACRVPVIVYNKTSLPEVVGEAGIKVNNPNELSQAIINLSGNNKLYRQLVKKGLQRSLDFSWKKVCREYMNLFASISPTNS